MRKRTFFLIHTHGLSHNSIIDLVEVAILKVPYEIVEYISRDLTI